MLLTKIEDVNPNYRQEVFDGEDLKGLAVYLSSNSERIGTLDTLLVDEFGHFRYFVVDTGFWIFGKKFLLPVGLCQVDFETRRVRATGFKNKEQVERLPRYEDGFAVNDDDEERVRGADRISTVEASVPVEASLPLEAVGRLEAARPIPTSHLVSGQPIASSDRSSYTDECEHQQLKLYEERLVVEKSRHKIGEIGIGKRVKTETSRISVPIEKERVVIERTPAKTLDELGTMDRPFEQQERVRLEVYEETAEIQKQAFVREEVEIRKECEQVTIEKVEPLRREVLNIKTTQSSDSNQSKS